MAVVAVALSSLVSVAPAAASGPSFVRAFGLNVGGTGVDLCTVNCQQGTSGAAAGAVNYPYGVAVAGSGDVYVADEGNSRIDEFSQSGSFVRAFGADVGGAGIDVCTTNCQQGTSGGATGELDGPSGVGVAGSGDIYVADEGNQRIDEFSQSGSFLRAFGANVGGPGVNLCTTTCQQGSAGGAAGELYDPESVGVAGSGNVYVADAGNDRIDEFSQSGSFVRAFGADVGGAGIDVCTTSCQQGTSGSGAGALDNPLGAAVAASGDVYVADENNNRIDEFTQSGGFVRAFGADVGGAGIDVCTTSCQHGTSGRGAGELDSPLGVAVAGSGDLYLADGDNRIDEFSQSGSFVRAFGADVGGAGIDVCTTSCQQGTTGGGAGELDEPYGDAVAGSGDVYVADLSNERIDEWSPYKATPVLSTSATASASVGSPIFDTASLSGGNNPTGTITFDAYSTSGCSGTPAFASGAATVSDGEASSGEFKPAAAGKYYWTATYSGDAANDSVISSCDATHETSIVTPAAKKAGVKITSTNVSQRKHRTTFKFRALGTATGFQCALIKRPTSKHTKAPKPHFSSCKSPKTYEHLKAGKYSFEVRAVNAAGKGAPASKSFRIS